MVAGTCTMGTSTFAVAGLLIRLREGQGVQMLEEQRGFPTVIHVSEPRLLPAVAQATLCLGRILS